MFRRRRIVKLGSHQEPLAIGGSSAKFSSRQSAMPSIIPHAKRLAWVVQGNMEEGS